LATVDALRDFGLGRVAFFTPRALLETFVLFAAFTLLPVFAFATRKLLFKEPDDQPGKSRSLSRTVEKYTE
jgi:hypothetical protein